ncbi:MAG: DUF2933 domain-containing protein [Chloroflexi bacterium]|nr:DUF2933 domain-containing protein [Chloroflexota bacterium]
MEERAPDNTQGKNRLGWLVGLLALVGIGALLIGIPLGTLLTFGLVLACPLFHVFMMRGMGHGAHHQAPELTPVSHGAHHQLPEPRASVEQVAPLGTVEMVSKAKQASKILLALLLGKEVTR